MVEFSSILTLLPIPSKSLNQRAASSTKISNMEQLCCHLKDLNGDLLENIMVRLDGSTLAAAASTSSYLRDVAQDQSLWLQLCHSTWPSTTFKESQHLISTSPIGGFDKFYADSFPLILYNKSISEDISNAPKRPKPKTHLSPSDFTSLVDVYYKGKCIFSKVLDGIPEAVDVDVDDDNDIGHTANDHQRWFSDCPFKMDLLYSNYQKDTSTDIYENGGDPHNGSESDSIRALPSVSLGEAEDGRWGEDFCKKLMDNFRLSWVLLDKKKGKAVNLSSWKPLSVRRSWPSDGDCVMHFGCVVPVEEIIGLPQDLAECVILARCRLMDRGRCLRWREISIRIEDMAGTHVSGRKSLMVLNQALHCLRSKNHLEVEKGYSRYERQKREMKRKKECRETLADKLCVLIEIAVFVTFCYACTIFF